MLVEVPRITYDLVDIGMSKRKEMEITLAWVVLPPEVGEAR